MSAYAALVLTLPFADSCTSSTEEVMAQPSLFLHLADRKTIKEAGEAYRKLFPKENNKTTLNELLMGNISPTNKSSLEKILNEHVLQDFKTGKTVK